MYGEGDIRQEKMKDIKIDIIDYENESQDIKNIGIRDIELDQKIIH